MSFDDGHVRKIFSKKRSLKKRNKEEVDNFFTANEIVCFVGINKIKIITMNNDSGGHDEHPKLEE